MDRSFFIEILLCFLLIIIVLTSISCNKNNDDDTNMLIDARDGKVYKTVTIGSQTWMAENLNYHTANSWCYENKTAFCTAYGSLYDWETAMNREGSSAKGSERVKGICPEGWHLPGDEEWEILINYLGGELIAGGKMKERDTLHWFYPNDGATNESGFNGLPGGIAFNDSTYAFVKYTGSWWSSTSHNLENLAWSVTLKNNTHVAERAANEKNMGFSVRCLKN